MNERRTTLGSILISIPLICVLTSTAYSSECSDVYMNSTRNVTATQRQQTELAYYFNRHCQKTGEVNESSLAIGVDLVVKKIPFKFTGTSTNSRANIEEFCKTGVQQNYFSAQAQDYRDEVVVAALQSFNQCLEIENKGLRLTHQEQRPRSVLIHGALTNTTTTATLDAATYDSKTIRCESTNFSKDGKAISIDGKQSLNIKKNFTISCKRIPTTIDGKKEVYPRTTVGISTSLGPYTVELLEDELLGFNLASQARANYMDAIAQRDAAKAEVAATKARADQLQTRLDSVSVELNTVSYGEYDDPSTMFFKPRLYCGSDIDAHIKQQCGDRKAFTKALGAHGGNKCGYGHWVYACLNK